MHSWTSNLRRVGLGFVALGLAGAAYATSTGNELGTPTDNAACCQLTTSLVNDVLRGKDVAGDERFFATDGAPPNIHFLVDASGSMRELPQVINSKHSEFFDLTTNGCDNPRLDAYEVSRAWNPSFQYPVPDTGTGLGADNGFPNLFRDDKFYAYMYWNDSSNPSYQWNTKEEACQSQVLDWNTTNTAVYDRCVECLGTKGFWKLPGATARDQAPLTNLDFIFWGRFLNFDPPKYVTAKAVLKAVIKDLKRVRAGISIFAPNTNPTLTSLLQGQNPSCSQILNDSSAFDNNRASYINSINGLTFTTGTPLARSLLNVGYYFTSDRSVYETKFGFGAAYTYPNEFKNGPLNSQGRSVCWGCQTSSVIIITDGEPSNDTVGTSLANAIRTLNGGPVYCPASAPCNVGPLNSDRDYGNNLANVLDDNNQLYLDDVAKFLYEKDLQANTPPQVGDFNTAGKQSVITYTVGFGVNSNLLKHTAEVGGGLYFTADDGASLKQAILDIISNVQTRATSFSSPAASSLQVRAASSTLIPRFKPARSKVEPWQGFLYRFKEGPERLLGCDPANPAAQGDLNQDGDCDDTLLIDKDGDAVTEDDEGQFMKLLNPTTPAKPFWEAGEVMRPANGGNTTRWMSRKIYTIVDNGTGSEGGTKSYIDFNDTPLAFDVTNAGDVDLLREYMGIPNTANACPELASKLGVPTLSGTECAKVIIKWYRGADALNPDPALRDFDRPFLLGDIFHSAPANVDPPMPKNFCAFSTQCLSTLHSGTTPQASGYSTSHPTDGTAYDKYVDSMANRDKIALVGANDGMLHAFANGQAGNTVDTLTGQYLFDDGTGKELWAFIPPDMLPKLRPNIGKHGYFVDGAPMVRDVWFDGLPHSTDLPSDLDVVADNKKQAGEFHTVAIIGTGRGGVHRFAMDLTRLLGSDPGQSVGRVPDKKGDFLWMWPQPCDPLALQAGESFSNFSPRAPPMGPVALTDQADEALRVATGYSAPGTGPWNIDNTAARERWVVGFNGGYDEHMLRGRGMAFVDIASGRTVWSFFYGDGQNRSQNLKYPIAAGISMFDIDQGNQVDVEKTDKLWDSGTVGDYGGQLWMLRFWKPGVWDSTKGRVNNWFAARAFRVANMMTGKSTDAETMRAPFAYATVNALQPDTGFVRTFVGTGDKENLLEKGTACRLSNPRGCAVQGCGVNNTIVVKRGGNTTLTTNSTYVNYHYSSGSSAPGTEGQSCSGSEVTFTWNNDTANGCSNGNDGTIQYKCDGDATTWSCRETQNTWAQLNYVTSTPAFPQRYYGIYAYGGQSTARRFDDDASATTYDNNLLTDGNLTNVGQFDNMGKVVAASQVSAAPSGNGWYVQYGLDNERTATSGTLLAGCVIFRTFEPSGASGAVCSTTGTNIARTYQANFSTGVADCALGFYDKDHDQWARYIQGTTVAAPAEPAPQVAIGGGEIGQGISLPEPGQGSGGASGGSHVDITSNPDAAKSFYQLELDRRGHACRHDGDLTACD